MVVQHRPDGAVLLYLHGGGEIAHGMIGHHEIVTLRVGVQIGGEGTVCLFAAFLRQTAGERINGIAVDASGVVGNLGENIALVAQINQPPLLIHFGSAEGQPIVQSLHEINGTGFCVKGV